MGEHAERGFRVENIVVYLEGVETDRVWELVRAVVKEALGCELGR